MKLLRQPLVPLFLVACLLPPIDMLLPREWQFASMLRPIFLYAILGLGLNIVTGYTGVLHLGTAGFMAVGAYAFSILTCDIFPFQLSFFPAIALATAIGGGVGLLLGLPTSRLTGDYLAIVTLGFGEIIQALLRNLESITKGTQGINPLPAPVIFGYAFSPEFYVPWYYLFLAILLFTAVAIHNVRFSRVGRGWLAIREDELAAKCMGVAVSRQKLVAFAFGSAVCTLAGALWASHLGSSTEPSNYDFQISIIALCIVIVGGMGSIRGAILGAVVMVGFNSILLEKFSATLLSSGIISPDTVYFKPSNWKFAIFGLALIVMMRVKPDGLFAEREQEA